MPEKLAKSLPSQIDARNYDIFIVPKNRAQFDCTRLDAAVVSDERLGTYTDVDAMVADMRK
jgi:hypothetical protein